jgi:hypothetical protein
LLGLFLKLIFIGYFQSTSRCVCLDNVFLENSGIDIFWLTSTHPWFTERILSINTTVPVFQLLEIPKFLLGKHFLSTYWSEYHVISLVSDKISWYD